jgi:hypothetical protein
MPTAERPTAGGKSVAMPEPAAAQPDCPPGGTGRTMAAGPKCPPCCAPAGGPEGPTAPGATNGRDTDAGPVFVWKCWAGGGPAWPGAMGARKAGSACWEAGAPNAGPPPRGAMAPAEPPGTGGVDRAPGATSAGWAGLRRAGSGCRSPPAAPGAKPAERTAGPGDTGRWNGAADGPRLSWRATAGVTPAVATVGLRGCWPIKGRAWASWAGRSAGMPDAPAATRSGRSPAPPSPHRG